MGYQEFGQVAAKRSNGPRLWRMWSEDPVRAVAWMDDRVLSAAEVQFARDWNGGERPGWAAAVPVALVGEDAYRVVEVFGPLGTRDDGMPLELIVYPWGGGFVTEDPLGGRVASATFEAALNVRL